MSTNDPLPNPPNTPFDVVAARYDAEFTETETGRKQRELVWQFLERHIPLAGKKVLELNCGTGADAIWLAQHGAAVLATDISTAMVAITRRKSAEQQLTHRIETQAVSMEQIHSISKTARKFDLVFSNFGGLNCISPQQLRRLNRDLRDLLNPGGIFVGVVMGRVCFWEMLYYTLKGKIKTAFRRFARGPLEVQLGVNNIVTTWYYTPDQFKRYFPDFTIRSVRSIGFWLPPSYLDPFFRRFPRCLQALNRMEKWCSGAFWAKGADHFLIHLQII